MSRRRARRPKYQLPQAQRVHDRTQAIIPHNAKICIDEVDDAYELPEFADYDPARGELHFRGKPKVTVVRSIRTDPLGALKAQGVIDEVQFLAGQIWQWSYVRSELGPLKAIDLTQEAVDGGRRAELPNEQVKRATANLRKARAALGIYSEALVTDILGKGMTIAKAADARSMYSKSGREYLGKRFRECLDCLAVVFGCATVSGPLTYPHHNLTSPH